MSSISDTGWEGAVSLSLSETKKEKDVLGSKSYFGWPWLYWINIFTDLYWWFYTWNGCKTLLIRQLKQWFKSNDSQTTL